ncbi:copper homeostasis protein [Arthrobacter sp. SLBN-112]|uniref:copper homeostasis protein CutC n=1 Tax=Arthrobacter sp. SLBN-112 TaxID=2768452 RepID=UPI0011745245|nr:copper homeostasis protein CutC [Arthrobacter sp. SLBN-112]TQJ38574.1 copper homeostasis protein [Arthrobacter sp. SLBN-112]
MAGALSTGQGTPAAVRRPQLELAVENADGVLLAAAVGAARVELCAALAETEGITPSIGTIEQACGLGLPVHVLVRPRPGNFTYSPGELDVIERDAAAALGAGAAGVVVGVLASDGGPDVKAIRRVVAAARAVRPDAEVTFHRAFDAALAAGLDPAEALSRLEEAGVDRVLTSGGGPDCAAGLEMLGRIVKQGRRSAPSVQIMAGGGVTLALVPSLLEAGVHAVHTSARPRYGGGDRAGAADHGLAARMAAAVSAVPLMQPTNEGQ